MFEHCIIAGRFLGAQLDHTCFTDTLNSRTFVKCIWLPLLTVVQQYIASNVVLDQSMQQSSVPPSNSCLFHFSESSHACNLSDCDCLYDTRHCRSYSSEHIAIGNLVREICSTHTSIPHFTHSELDAIVSALWFLCTCIFHPSQLASFPGPFEKWAWVWG